MSALLVWCPLLVLFLLDKDRFENGCSCQCTPVYISVTCEATDFTCRTKRLRGVDMSSQGKHYLLASCRPHANSLNPNLNVTVRSKLAAPATQQSQPLAIIMSAIQW